MSEQIKATAYLLIKDSLGTPYDLKLTYIGLNLTGAYEDRYFEARYKPTSQVQNEWKYLISTDFGDADTDIDEEHELDAIFETVLSSLNGEIKKVFGLSEKDTLTGEAGIKWILEKEIFVEGGEVVRKKIV